MRKEEKKPTSLELGANYTNGSRRSHPQSFPGGTSAPGFSSSSPSCSPYWLPPWVTASGAHVTSALTPASPRPRQKRGRESCRVEKREAGGRRTPGREGDPQAPRQAGTEGLHQMRNRFLSIYFSAVEIHPTTA